MTNRIRIQLVSGVALTCCLLPISVSPGQDPAATATQAVERYTNALDVPDRAEQVKEFEQSQQLFRQVLESHAAEGRQSSADLWIAFGNSSLQSEQIGWAVLAFRHALLLDPANTQARQNLQFAQSLVSGWNTPEPARNFGGTLFFWKNQYSLSSQLVLAAVVFLLGGLVLSAGILLLKRWLMWLSLVPFTLWIVLSLPLATASIWEEPETGVVVAEAATLRTADSASAPVRLEAGVPAGAELEVVSMRGEWVEVGFQSGSGWLMAHEFRTIKQPFGSSGKASSGL